MVLFAPPFKVHLARFRSATDPLCQQCERALYSFLHRPLDDDFVLRPGVEIPVEVGRELTGLLAALERGTEPPAGTRLIVALLDSGAFDDPAAHDVVARAVARWADARRDEILLPILIDDRWAGELSTGPVEALAGIALRPPVNDWAIAADVGVVAGRALLRRLYDANPPRPKVFISHAKADGARLAEQIAAFLRADTRVEAWLDKTDIERGEELGKQLLSATSDGVALVVRTDKYSESPWCGLELLAAKRARVPIVTLIAGSDGEPLTSPYSGNHRTMIWREGRELELVGRCVQAWVHAHYFRQYATAALALAGLPADSEVLTRRPELLDVMSGGTASRVIVHPDPPLTDAESTLLFTARPSVRLATPTTLFGRVLLDKDPEPPLSGMVVAFSLSTAEELPSFERALESGTGVTQKHLEDVLDSIVVTTVHSGAKIAYGGDFRRGGYTQTLSGVLRSRRRLGTSMRTQLLVFLRPDEARAGDAAREIDYSPVKVPLPAGLPGTASSETKSLIWHLAMREEMASLSHARIVLGGKTRPKRDATDTEGYQGPWPGVLEETWRMLRAGRGVFVIGGFSGLAGVIAQMLTTGEVPVVLRRNTHPELAERAQDFIDTRLALRATTSRDVLLLDEDDKPLDLQHLAERVLADWQAFTRDAGEAGRWSNGLTRQENEILFTSTDRTEITHLVFEGLRRIRRGAQTTLKTAIYRGDIALVPNVSSYAVTLTPGVPPVGASVALDKRMGGRISTIAAGPLEPLTVVATGGGDLAGSQVILARLDLPPPSVALGADQVASLAEDVMRKADALGITSIACAAFASTMGLDIGESARAMRDGFMRANPQAVRTVVFCETDGARYELLRTALGQDLVELRSGPTAASTDRPAVIHVEAQPAAAGWSVRSTLFLPDGAEAIVPRSEVVVDNATWDKLRKRARAYTASVELGQTLWTTLLSAEIRTRLSRFSDRRVVVLSDENGSGLPWEFLADDRGDALACRQGLVRRIALTGPSRDPDPADRAHARLKVLLVVNPLDDLPNTIGEADDIERVLRGRPDVEVERLEGASGAYAATLPAIVERLASGTVDILHYAGHAFFDPADRTRSGLRVAGGILTAAQLPATRPPRLVYLSACESLRVRGDEAPLEPPSSQSLAEALLRSGVTALVGTFFAVADDTAKVFASTMYTQIAAGRALGAAVLEARRVLVGARAPDWGNFMVYGDDQLII